MSAPLLEVRDLRIAFDGLEVVRGVDLEVAPGECVAIVGESGSGKSVTARALIGLAGHGADVRADALRWRGEDLRDARESRWRRLRGTDIALVLQDALSALDPLRRVGAEVAEAMEVHDAPARPRRRARVLELLDSVGVPTAAQRARQYPHELSGGLRQRALIASALAGSPSLIIADEPTTALDVTVQAQILDLLRDLKEQGTALVLISHDLAVVASLADRVLVMRDGEVVERGAAHAVLTEPRHDYTRSLLDAVPSAATRGRSLSDGRDVVAAAAHGEVVLALRGVSRTFLGSGGHRVVAADGVDLEVRRGEIVGLVGESGSGKTTVGRIALGFERPQHGSVELLGEPWSAVPERLRRTRRWAIQQVSQDTRAAFDPRHGVRRALHQALRRAGVPRAEREDRAAAALERVGLGAEVLDRRPGTLSGGQRQRVAIARALVLEPRVLVCDEAVSALDVSVQAQVLDLLAGLRRETGVAIVFITHDLGVVQHLADRVLVMTAGRIVEQGAVGSVFREPRHPYTQRLLASIPRLPHAAPAAAH